MSVIGLCCTWALFNGLKRWQIIFGKPQGVDDLPANGKLRQPRNRKCPYHLIAKTEAPSGLWCKSAGEAFGASLLGLDKGTQAALHMC